MLNHLFHIIRPDSRQSPGRAAYYGVLGLLTAAVLFVSSCQVVPTPITNTQSPTPAETTRVESTPTPETTESLPTSGSSETTGPTSESTVSPEPTDTSSPVTPTASPTTKTTTKPTPTRSPSPTSRPTAVPTLQPTAAPPTPTTPPAPTSPPTPTSAPTATSTPVPPVEPDFPYRNYGTFFRDDYGTNSNIVSSSDGGVQLDIGSVSRGVALVNVSTTSVPLETNCKVVAAANGSSYQYEIMYRGKFLGIPLQLGQGEYKLNVYAQVAGGGFREVFAHTFPVEFPSSLRPYLAASLMTDFSRGSGSVRTAASICSGIETTNGRVEAVYNWIVNNIRYDSALANAITSGQVTIYVPDPDTTFNTKKGICFDYASLMCAMLRSQGIPTRLIVGQTPLGYHAWNEVYFSGTGWVVVASFSWREIDGSGWVLFDTTLAAGGMPPQNIIDTTHTKQKTY